MNFFPAYKFGYRVAATPAQVVRALAASCSGADGSWLSAISWTDRNQTPLIGHVTATGFYLRLPQGLGSAPRVLAMRGHVAVLDSGAIVSGQFGFRTAVRLAEYVYLGLVILVSGLLLPAVAQTPAVGWVVVMFAGFALAFFAPFWWIARYERAELGKAMEGVLRGVAPITSVQIPSA